MESHNYYSKENPMDLMIDKRKQRCFPNVLKPYKAPLVSDADFPSRISLPTAEPSVNDICHVTASEESALNVQLQQRPPISHWRRAEQTDEAAIRKLVAKSQSIVNDLFGEPDIANLIEKSVFSIVQYNSNQEMVSFVSTFSYPKIPAVPSFEWFLWLENSYRIKDASPRNSVFIHYLAWDLDYTYDFLRLSMETMFLEITFLTHVMITKPPNVKIPGIISQNFIQILPKDSKTYDCEQSSFQTVLVCLKHSVMERLKIRLAMVEDHDDLMPIAEQHTDRLKELYGEFCMAEIIQYPGTTDRKTLVCESMGFAVGFMNINRAVDFDLLNSQFDLGAFNGLRKPNENDQRVSDINLEDDSDVVYLPDRLDPTLDVINSKTILKFLNWQPSLCASQEDVINYDQSHASITRYNELSNSMANLLTETLNLKLSPKFSAHALSTANLRPSQPFSRTSLTSVTGDVQESEPTTTSSELSLLSLQCYNLPIYHGPPNAFCIEFFAMHNNFDDRLCHDFLEAAFEVFPDLDYCLLTIPSQAPAFPLLDSFARVTPRPLKRFKQELYVCHKSSVMITFMRVRRITKVDLPEIRTLLTGIKNKECIYADAASSCFYEDSAYQGFVLICFKSIVGVAVLCNEDQMEYLAHHYHVSDLIDFDLHKIEYHAILKHLILSPIYQAHARFFLRDIMRMADITSLYRTRYEEAETTWSSSSIINVLGHLIPVKPRHMIKYDEKSLGVNVPPPYLLHKDAPFSLYHINTRICGVKKFTCNINVVVVGSSRTAFAFLEALLFAPSSAYVIYNNVTLVSPHGYGTELPSHPARDYIFPFKGRFSRYYKIQVCLKTYVNFVYGVMTEINRTEKYITVNNDSILPYDYLILLCGRQFIMPVPCSLISEVKGCRRNYRPRCSLFKYLITQQSKKEQETTTVYPANVFIINTVVDATNAFITLQYLLHKRHGVETAEKVIIYGHHLRTYLCVQALIKYGVPARMIVVVEPIPSGKKKISCFRDHNVDTAILNTLTSLGIDHYEGYVLYDWTFCNNNNQVREATFHSDHRKMTIPCLAMFPHEEKLVSEVTFKAVNEASLVYDGKLVINSSFQTNDDHIYAAGGMTKYKRRYYATDRNHRYYSSKEVGSLLAEIIRKKIDPTVQESERIQKPSETVPDMKEPLVISGTLPGDWNFLFVRKPGKQHEIETNTTIQKIGDILTTGDCQMSKGYGYFKLTLDSYGFVENILCYTKDTIDVSNLELLYGKHEKLLNDLLSRFDLGMIDDFYSYFRQPWIYAIFHDRFKMVQQNNYELLQEQSFEYKGESLVNLVLNILRANNWKRPNQRKLDEIKDKFNRSKLKQNIIDNILDFLYFNDEPFPMYATPRILRVLLREANTSLLHKAAPDVVKPAVKIEPQFRD